MPSIDRIVMCDRTSDEASLFVYPHSLTIVEHPDKLEVGMDKVSTIYLSRSHITNDADDILVTIVAGDDNDIYIHDVSTAIVNAKALRSLLTTADVIDWPMAKALVAKIDTYEEEERKYA